MGDDDRSREQLRIRDSREHLLKRRALPTRETNCFGLLSRETGHSRVPAPPHMITGMI